MAKKITELTELTTSNDVHGTDELIINDRSDTTQSDNGSTKRLLVSTLSGAIGGGGGGTSYTDSDVDTHLNTSGATNGQVLSYTSSDYAWVDQSSGGGSVDSTVQEITPTSNQTWVDVPLGDGNLFFVNHTNMSKSANNIYALNFNFQRPSGSTSKIFKCSCLFIDEDSVINVNSIDVDDGSLSGELFTPKSSSPFENLNNADMRRFDFLFHVKTSSRTFKFDASSMTQDEQGVYTNVNGDKIVCPAFDDAYQYYPWYQDNGSGGVNNNIIIYTMLNNNQLSMYFYDSLLGSMIDIDHDNITPSSTTSFTDSGGTSHTVISEFDVTSEYVVCAYDAYAYGDNTRYSQSTFSQ